MLLIGSRAIGYHFPDFRPPRDWDLIGSEDEIARLARSLPESGKHRRAEKAHFRYGEAVVEVANASAVPYWAKVLAKFAHEPILEEPTLGPLRIAPAPYLLLTKQCGLIYRILHWHKNLEDLYFMRERIPTIPDAIAALLPDALADSRRMFQKSHEARANEPWACHPELSPPAEPELHEELHTRMALGAAPMRDQPGAWQGFLELPTGDRKAKMRVLFAEEAMVLAAYQYLRPSSNLPTLDEDTLTRWALRALIQSRLPEAWRYFGVNHYREIRDLVPEGFLGRLGQLPRVAHPHDTACAIHAPQCRGQAP